jgi:hypothetical protein
VKAPRLPIGAASDFARLFICAHFPARDDPAYVQTQRLLNDGPSRNDGKTAYAHDDRRVRARMTTNPQIGYALHTFLLRPPAPATRKHSATGVTTFIRSCLHRRLVSLNIAVASDKRRVGWL